MKTSIGMGKDKILSIEHTPNVKNARPNKGHSLLLATDDFVSIDIETTGLSTVYDEIIELGAARYRAGNLVDTFSSLVKPVDPVSPFITKLTGITNEALESAPVLSNVLPQFLDFIGNDIIVGHNVNFDINFIYDACSSLGFGPFVNDFIDTMRLARRMYREFPNHKLDTLMKHFDLEQRDLHRGLNDCELTAACYKKMVMDDHFAEATKLDISKKKLQLSELVAQEGYENPDSPLYGKVCVFTGTLENFSRKEAAQLVVNIGGICADRVTKKTNFLILGNNDYCSSIKDGKSTKQKAAETLIADGADLAIITEAVFLDLLQEDYSLTEQPSKISSEKSNAISLEYRAFQYVAPTLKEALEKDNLSPDYLQFKQSKTSNAQYSSAYLFNENTLLFRISFRVKAGYLSIPSEYAKIASEKAECVTRKSDPNYSRIAISKPEDIMNYTQLLKQILELEVDAHPTDFGCCSRYEECSNAKKCIHPDPDMAIRCVYRKNLKKGKVFYGKNRNID